MPPTPRTLLAQVSTKFPGLPDDGTHTIYHMGLDVRGAIHNWNDRQMNGVFLHDDGRIMTAREAREFLMDQIALGRKVIPCDPAACDAWDYERGCPGHPV